ncbi:MAG TPA: class I SAM-dependent methyltransferase [Longimicrobiaceae bacterium]|nr:class I SAM-dependent methyltransferase [Longimicrobiaceae bacterium]
MTASLYSDPRLYDLMFPATDYGPFYAGEARRAGGPVLELACGTGRLLVPIAREGVRAVGLDLSAAMLAAAREHAREAGVAVEFVEGDMRAFDLGERFALVFVGRNSLLHLHRTEDLLACFASVRRHLLPGGAFVFDVFNPNFRILGAPSEERLPVMRLAHPEKGEVLVEQASDYDKATQVNRATWYFSAAGDPDFLVMPLHLRSIFPQELPLLLAAGGFRLEARYGGPAREPFAHHSHAQVCICRAA